MIIESAKWSYLSRPKSTLQEMQYMNTLRMKYKIEKGTISQLSQIRFLYDDFFLIKLYYANLMRPIIVMQVISEQMKKEECRRDCLFRRLLQQTMLDKVRPKAATLKTESFEMTILRREETTDPTMIIYSKSQGLPLSCAKFILQKQIYIGLNMWIKKLFTKQSKTSEPNSMQQDEDHIQSTIHTVSQQQVDLRYSQLRIINNKTLHLPHNQIHKIESVFFEQKNLFMAKQKHEENYNSIEHIIITDRQILMVPDFLYFSSLKKKVNTSNCLHIYFGMIENVQLIEMKKQIPKLQFTLKDNRVFYIKSILMDKLKAIEKLIRQFGFPNGINKFYAFKYGKVNKKTAGWDLYTLEGELKRQQVIDYVFNPMLQSQPSKNHVYQIVNNQRFNVCQTYPQHFVVPLRIPQESMIKCSKFRTKERLPVLTFFYEYAPKMFTSLFRCSQIKGGILNARCEDDERMIKEIDLSARLVCQKYNKTTRINCKIYDARGYYAAFGNRLAGKGFQNSQHYNCQFQFLNIPNIHAVRQSYNKIKSYNFMASEFFDVVAESGWIDFLYLILSGVKSMVKSMLSGVNVIVHCSDGWDRTSQLAALTQLIVDPYYRTIQGFAVLIEKDWRSYGHKFRQRSGQFNLINYRSHEISPVFIQFLDCILQVISQFPLSFEYNIHLLNCLAIEYQSCTYGTFLTNNCKEAKEINLEKLTISIWSDILEEKDKYTNKFYVKNGPKILDISVDTKDYVIWKEHFIGQLSPKEQQWDILQRQRQINANLKQNLTNYDHQLEALRLKILQS